jgi:hypothetical protein
MQRPRHKIRPPPVDHVNNLWHHHKCQRALASTAIQIRRNALFTSPEYAISSHFLRGVERGDDRSAQFAQQGHQVAAGRTTVNSELVLD